MAKLEREELQGLKKIASDFSSMRGALDEKNTFKGAERYFAGAGFVLAFKKDLKELRRQRSSLGFLRSRQ